MAKVLLIAYDNGSHIPFFPINLFYLMGALVKEKHQVGLWHQDIHHGKEEALTKILDENPFDVVGLGFSGGYYQYEKAKLISAAVNRSKRRKEFRYVLGGHGPGAVPDYFLGCLNADTVIVGDGEHGIMENKKGVVQGRPCDQDEAPLNCYRYFPMDIYRLIRWPTSSGTDFCFPILSSRGCKWNCSFCYRMRDGFYERSVEAIIEEIKYLHREYHINHFQFADELLMSSEKRTEEICEVILGLSFKIKWDCSGRLNFATSKILQKMRKCGCEYINYGIESLDQTILNEMGKGLSLNQIVSGVEATRACNLSPGLNLIWGFPGDTTENLSKAVEFIKKYDPGDELRTIRPVTPYPGTRLYKQAIEKGLLEGPEDFYEKKHKNSDLFTINFMDIPTDVAHKKLYSANVRLLENYLQKRGEKTQKAARGMYFEGRAFRGFRSV